MKFLVPIDLSKNELQNAVLQNLSAAPSTPKAGQIYFNSTDELVYTYTGTEWKAVGAPINTIKWSAIEETPTTFGVGGYGITDISLDAGAKTLVIGSARLENLVTDPNYVHTDENFTAALKAKLDSVMENAEPNKIDSITVNNSPISPVGKTVNITVPTKTSELSNDNKFITSNEAPVQSVNGGTGAVTITPTSIGAVPKERTINKKPLSANIDLTPTDIGALSTKGGTMSGAINMGGQAITNLAQGSADNDAVTKKQMENAIASIGNVFNFKGSKSTKSELPPSGNVIGDVWYVEDEQVGYIWIKDSGSSGRWEQLGPTIDLSGYLAGDKLLQTTGSETTNTMSQNAITVELNKKATKDELQSGLNKKAEKTVVNSIPIVKTATKNISTSATSATVAYTGTIINVFAKDATGEEVVLDIDYDVNQVVFSTASAPDSIITCTVVYF